MLCNAYLSSVFEATTPLVISYIMTNVGKDKRLTAEEKDKIYGYAIVRAKEMVEREARRAKAARAKIYRYECKKTYNE